MLGNLPSRSAEAISVAADNCRQWQHLADALWFAALCRELWGENAAKELCFLLGKSDRTCRAWAAGDCEPPARVLAHLIISDHGLRVVSWIVRDAALTWWANVQRAIRITKHIDKLDLG